MLKIKLSPGFNIWNFVRCPLCNGSDFESHDYAKVYCEKCWTIFTTHTPSADSGIIVHATFEEYHFFNSKIKLCAEFRSNFQKYSPILCKEYDFIKNTYDEYEKKLGVFERIKLPEPLQSEFTKAEARISTFFKTFLTLGRVMKTGEYDNGWGTWIKYPDNSTYEWRQKSNSDRWFDYVDIINLHGDS